MAIKIKKRSKKSGEDGTEDVVDSLLEQDQFLATSDKSISWAAQNRDKVIIGSVALVLIAAAAIFFYQRSQEGVVERSNVLTEAVDAMATPIAPPKPAADAPPLPNADDPGPQYDTAEKKYTEVGAKADAVLSEYDEGEVANTGKLIKARSLLGLGKHEEAITLYQEWLDANPKSLGRPVILQALATAQAGAGKSDEAVATLNQLKELDTETYGEMASYQVARIHDTAGNKDKAKEGYDAFIKAYPDSARVELAKLRRDTL